MTYYETWDRYFLVISYYMAIHLIKSAVHATNPEGPEFYPWQNYGYTLSYTLSYYGETDYQHFLAFNVF